MKTVSLATIALFVWQVAWSPVLLLGIGIAVVATWCATLGGRAKFQL